jgi:hypothetical protein
MSPAFTVENVSRFSGAFAFAPLRLFGTADVNASFIAADNLLFWRSDRFFQNVSHFEVSLGAVRATMGSNVKLFYSSLAR